MLYFQPEGIGFKMWVRQATEVLVISAESETLHMYQIYIITKKNLYLYLHLFSAITPTYLPLLLISPSFGPLPA